jgi:hypothetical protein
MGILMMSFLGNVKPYITDFFFFLKNIAIDIKTAT